MTRCIKFEKPKYITFSLKTLWLFLIGPILVISCSKTDPIEIGKKQNSLSAPEAYSQLEENLDSHDFENFSLVMTYVVRNPGGYSRTPDFDWIYLWKQLASTDFIFKLSQNTNTQFKELFFNELLHVHEHSTEVVHCRPEYYAHFQKVVLRYFVLTEGASEAGQKTLRYLNIPWEGAYDPRACGNIFLTTELFKKVTDEVNPLGETYDKKLFDHWVDFLIQNSLKERQLVEKTLVGLEKEALVLSLGFNDDSWFQIVKRFILSDRINPLESKLREVQLDAEKKLKLRSLISLVSKVESREYFLGELIKALEKSQGSINPEFLQTINVSLHNFTFDEFLKLLVEILETPNTMSKANQSSILLYYELLPALVLAMDYPAEKISNSLSDIHSLLNAFSLNLARKAEKKVFRAATGLDKVQNPDQVIFEKALLVHNAMARAFVEILSRQTPETFKTLLNQEFSETEYFTWIAKRTLARNCFSKETPEETCEISQQLFQSLLTKAKESSLKEISLASGSAVSDYLSLRNRVYLSSDLNLSAQNMAHNIDQMCGYLNGKLGFKEKFQIKHFSEVQDSFKKSQFSMGCVRMEVALNQDVPRNVAKLISPKKENGFSEVALREWNGRQWENREKLSIGRVKSKTPINIPLDSVYILPGLDIQLNSQVDGGIFDLSVSSHVGADLTLKNKSYSKNTPVGAEFVPSKTKNAMALPLLLGFQVPLEGFKKQSSSSDIYSPTPSEKTNRQFNVDTSDLTKWDSTLNKKNVAVLERVTPGLHVFLFNHIVSEAGDFALNPEDLIPVNGLDGGRILTHKEFNRLSMGFLSRPQDKAQSIYLPESGGKDLFFNTRNSEKLLSELLPLTKEIPDKQDLLKKAQQTEDGKWIANAIQSALGESKSENKFSFYNRGLDLLTGGLSVETPMYFLDTEYQESRDEREKQKTKINELEKAIEKSAPILKDKENLRNRLIKDFDYSSFDKKRKSFEENSQKLQTLVSAAMKLDAFKVDYKLLEDINRSLSLHMFSSGKIIKNHLSYWNVVMKEKGSPASILSFVIDYRISRDNLREVEDIWDLREISTKIESLGARVVLQDIQLQSTVNDLNKSLKALIELSDELSLRMENLEIFPALENEIKSLKDTISKNTQDLNTTRASILTGSNQTTKPVKQRISFWNDTVLPSNEKRDLVQALNSKTKAFVIPDFTFMWLRSQYGKIADMEDTTLLERLSVDLEWSADVPGTLSWGYLYESSDYFESFVKDKIAPLVKGSLGGKSLVDQFNESLSDLNKFNKHFNHELKLNSPKNPLTPNVGTAGKEGQIIIQPD
jgi:hypothetical protein